MYSLVFYVPINVCEAVKSAVFTAGAGRIGCYDQCSWQVLGKGQFRPLQGNQAFIGRQDTLEVLEEYRVEMVCADECVEQAVSALIKAHPYEEPAYMLVKLSN